MAQPDVHELIRAHVAEYARGKRKECAESLRKIIDAVLADLRARVKRKKCPTPRARHQRPS